MDIALPGPIDTSSSSSSTGGGGGGLSSSADSESPRVAINRDTIAEELMKRLNALINKGQKLDSIGTTEEEEESSSSSSAAGGGASSASASSSSKKNSKSRSRMTEDEEDRQLLEFAKESTKITRVVTQPKMVTGGTMRYYQLEGLNWMVRLHDNNVNGILADEMGLGKTLQTISLIAYMKETRCSTQPCLVITPKSTIPNWINELRKFAPQLKALRIDGSKEDRKDVIDNDLNPNEFDVAVCSYDSMLREKNALCKIKWNYVIIDEAQRIKNEESKLSKIVRLLQTNRKLLLTGTPLQNNLHELWALLNFLLPEVFDDSELFDSWFNIENTAGKDNVINRLHMVLKPFMLRRVKSDVETDLPPKKEIKLFTHLTNFQKDWYVKVLSKDIISLNSMSGSNMTLLNILMQLRKVCNHPYLFHGAEAGPPYVDGPHMWENAGKMMLLEKLLRKLKVQGSRVLIFCQMTRMLDIIEDYLVYQGYKYCRIDGNSSGDDRATHMDEFNKPGSEKFVFILSTRAGGLGINLQTADTVILYDSDWNPQVDLQAMDRAHRIGQKKQVRVFRFITEGTIEEKIVERAEKKLFLEAAVIQQGRLAEKHNNLSKGELMTMIRFGADEIINRKGEALTDEDIDVILAKGEARTKAETDKINDEMKLNLANFSMNLDDATEFNLFTFEGENFKGKKNQAAALAKVGGILDLPGRDRKRGSELMSELTASMGTQGQQRGQRKIKKMSNYPEYQFFSKKRIDEIITIENQLIMEKDDHMNKIKDLKAKLKQLRTRDEDYEETSNLITAEINKLQDDIDDSKFELPDSLLQEKDKLLSVGFRDFTRPDLKLFTDLFEKYGDMVKTSLVMEMCSMCDKDPEYIGRYYDVFMSRMNELTDYKKYLEKIARGNAIILREQQIASILSWKIQKSNGHLEDMKIAYAGSKGKGFSEFEDLFLVWQLHECGYGQWDMIRSKILESEYFLFDWYIRSRSSVDIQKRCDLLVKYILKEYNTTSSGGKKVGGGGGGGGGGAMGKDEDE